ncbi:oncoprotein-induced transcript 3 protein-like [Lingula anatina]|uniref:Oncoprotein-induced transcript 3 protein-like n=1 Tax=Lingula anatina TaxID=7574 RepID=A0A1S3K3T7_LINAN|nr:oncoprotein-induced transcript 3 protein-like [Lingula anatina]|eukprot:XP_013417298.1 oncoprotein-induced transcript 3 protein-like [Lingula anatina]
MIDARYQVLFLLGVLWAPVRANDDPCHSYQPITDEWRNINYGQKYFCDITHRWHGWYRFMGRAGNKMPDSAPSQRHCGTSYPIWLSGGHPKVSNGIVSRRLCTYYSSYTCTTSSQHGAFQVYEYAKVKKCPGGYYVYQLPNLQFTCNRAFCAVKDTSDPCLDSNCTYGCVNQNGQAQCTCPANVLNSNRNQSCGGHPTVKDGIVKRNICTRSSSSRCSCYFNSHTTFDYAMVRKCPGGYYVYKFPQFQWQYCHVNICGVTDTSDPCLNSTCTHGCTGDKGSPVCTCPRNLVLAEDKNTCSNISVLGFPYALCL